MLFRSPTVAQQTAFDEADREDTADALRRYAEDQTECFCDDAFDWRETETAGGWADEYPENVLFAVDDPESFTKRLVEIRNRQKETINWYLGQVMAGCETTDLAEIVEKLKEPDSSFMARRCLCGLANELDGRFTFKSEFYNCEDAEATVTDETLEQIRCNPEEWAIVLFDHHF